MVVILEVEDEEYISPEDQVDSSEKTSRDYHDEKGIEQDNLSDSESAKVNIENTKSTLSADDIPEDNDKAVGSSVDEYDDHVDDDDEDMDKLLEKYLVKDIKKATDAKERGNQFFVKGEYENALECYAEAILLTPEDLNDDQALFHNNKAAAHFMLQEWDDVIYETSQAIFLKEKFVKAILRRAKAYEKLDRLSEALDDYKTLVEIDAKDKHAAKKVQELEKIVAERFDKQKDEMLGKLKDFGNTILGKFGMSLDQFQAVQDPQTGSYSISFGNQPNPNQSAPPQ